MLSAFVLLTSAMPCRHELRGPITALCRGVLFGWQHVWEPLRDIRTNGCWNHTRRRGHCREEGMAVCILLDCTHLWGHFGAVVYVLEGKTTTSVELIHFYLNSLVDISPNYNHAFETTGFIYASSVSWSIKLY